MAGGVFRRVASLPWLRLPKERPPTGKFAVEPFAEGDFAGKEGGIERAVGFAKMPWPEGLEQAME